jgi:UDP-2-acetamido-3-amino-2,3-dideoxy-glucuronate N-acetyltransferase
MKRDIAVIGAGYWGKNIVRNMYELGRLKVVCDSNRDSLEQVKKGIMGVSFTEDYREILRDKDINGVMIATPAVTHYSIAREFLLADKNVFVEKPIALRIEDASDLISIARKRQLRLMVGHILHYHPAVRRIKDMVFSSELGRIYYLFSNRLNIGRIRTEENILWSFAPHDISLILSIVQDEPSDIIATGNNYLQQDVEDVTITYLKFKNGINAHIFVSWLNPFKEQKFVVVGEKGMLVFDDTLNDGKLSLYRHNIEWHKGQIPVAKRSEREIIPIDNNEPLKEECKHFLRCIDEGIDPITSGEEGLSVLRVLDLAQKSLKSGKWIKLSESTTVKNQDYFVHPTAIIDENVKIGRGTKIWHFSHILPGSEIGERCVLGQNVVVGPDVKIGNNCKIQNNVSVYKGVTVEDDVFMGPSMVFTNVYNPRAFIERKSEFLPTVLKKGCSIGANATIVCGHTIGEYAFIGAGAVVRTDVEPHALMVGVPAKQIGWVCFCGTTLKFVKGKATCKYCGKKFELKKKKLVCKEE